MADIRIEKKKPIWPWIFLIVILIILVFLYFYGSTESNEDIEETEMEEVTHIKSNMVLVTNEEARI